MPNPCKQASTPQTTFATKFPAYTQLRDLLSVLANHTKGGGNVFTMTTPVAWTSDHLNWTQRIELLEERFDNFTKAYDAVLAFEGENNDVFFVLVMACMVFFMQTGFAFLEAGAVRSKNVTNILIKNVLDSIFTCILYWSVGYAFAFGDPSNSFIGYNYFFCMQLPVERYHHWFFQCSFAATACTIISGALAERVEFVAYLIYACVTSGWIYPVITHWVWAADGWLAVRGFQDFAGSGCVHVCGGTVALVSCILLGPRLGRFPDKTSGRPALELCGHSTPLVTLGGFILAFGFLAFNGGSQGQISRLGDGEFVAVSMVNTVLAGSWSGLVVLFVTRYTKKHWSLLHTTNGLISGMVAICSGCNVMQLWAGSLTGFIAGLAYCCWSSLLPRLKIDDPVDAFAVHFGSGVWGMISTPLFSKTHGIVYFWNAEAFSGLAISLGGTLAIIIWSAGWALLTFGALKLLKLFRVPPEVEIRGLDIFKHKESAYPTLAYGHGWIEPWTWDEVKRLVIPSNLDDVEQQNHAASAGMNSQTRTVRPFHENPEIAFMDNYARQFGIRDVTVRRRHSGSAAVRRPEDRGSTGAVFPL